MTADELLERASSRLLTEYQLLFIIKSAEERGDRRPRPWADIGGVPWDEPIDEDDENDADDEPTVADDAELTDLIEKQRALIDGLQRGVQFKRPE